MLRISSYTFGCKLNQSETDSALKILADSGYEIVPWDSGADLYLINTCTVTSKGEQKARRLIRQVQRDWPLAVILAAGCYAVLERQKIEALGPRVCALPDQPAQLCITLAKQPLANNEELLHLLRDGIATQLAKGGRQLQSGVARQTDFPEVLLPNVVPSSVQKNISLQKTTTHKTRQRYFLKIQDGCNRTCSFCRIRIARGPSRSLAMPLLVQQLQQLEREGYTEAVITGVHINSYHYQHKNTGSHYFLGELLQELLGQTETIRLRLSSIEPENIKSIRSQQLFCAFAAQRVCPHFHISIQSGSEHVLRQMRRGYTANQQLNYIARLKELRPQAYFSCDVIVGFPGEREEDFEATYQLLRNNRFAAVHSFSYSPRPDTDAFTMPKVQESIVKQRMQRLQTLAKELQRQYLEHCLNRKAKILLEELHKGYWLGYSENYVRTKIAAPVDSSWQPGDLVQVRLQRSENQPSSNEEDLHNNSDEEFLLEGIPC